MKFLNGRKISYIESFVMNLDKKLDVAANFWWNTTHGRAGAKFSVGIVD